MKEKTWIKLMYLLESSSTSRAYTIHITRQNWFENRRPKRYLINKIFSQFYYRNLGTYALQNVGLIDHTGSTDHHLEICQNLLHLTTDQRRICTRSSKIFAVSGSEIEFPDWIFKEYGFLSLFQCRQLRLEQEWDKKNANINSATTDGIAQHPVRRSI